jgi:hypothetical protein
MVQTQLIFRQRQAKQAVSPRQVRRQAANPEHKQAAPLPAAPEGHRRISGRPATPAPGRLARHGHPSPPFRPGAPGRPVQHRANIPGPGTGRPARHDFRVVIGHRDHLHLARQADPSDRVNHQHQGAQPLQPRITVATTSLHDTTVTHQRPPAARDTKPEAHRGDVPRHQPTRRTSFYAAQGTRQVRRNLASGARPVRSQHRRPPRPTATSRPVTPHQVDGRHRLRRYTASR